MVLYSALNSVFLKPILIFFKYIFLGSYQCFWKLLNNFASYGATYPKILSYKQVLEFFFEPFPLF